ncbi:glycine zipper domain-containing protein [Hymenobacter saemangeumensis]
MKSFKSYFALLLTSFMLAGSVAEAQTTQPAPRKKWSGKAKGAAIGAGTGAATGAVVGGGKGAVVGGVVGAVGGGIIGRKKDKKKDPVRYEQYANKNDK